MLRIFLKLVKWAARDFHEIWKAEGRKGPFYGSHLLICCTHTKYQEGLQSIHLSLDSPPPPLTPESGCVCLGCNEGPWLLWDSLVIMSRLMRADIGCGPPLWGCSISLMVLPGLSFLLPDFLCGSPSSSSIKCRDNSLTEMAHPAPKLVKAKSL